MKYIIIFNMNSLLIKKFNYPKDLIRVGVPASKSVLNRALILSALSHGTVRLLCGSFGEDTRALLACLKALGIKTETQEEEIVVHGCGGNIPNKNAELNVMSAGTAARFLTVALAFCGGNYRMRSSAQMEKRPMEVLRMLEGAGVEIVYEKEPEHFPFQLHSSGINTDCLTVNTDESTQYASGVLLAATALSRPLTLILTGSRTHGSYIEMTLKLLGDFGVNYAQSDRTVTVFPAPLPPKRYEIEPDLSGACYFYALSLLFSTKVLVCRTHENSIQGDFRFLNLLREKGVKLVQTEEGLLADGTQISKYDGFTADMKDFSDQTLTIAALAPFATTPTELRGIAHIRLQECDRIHAIRENLKTLGVSTEWNGEMLTIYPATDIKAGHVKTYDDHRVAMAFALIGLKTGVVTIENPLCCKKTFDNYFDLIGLLN